MLPRGCVSTRFIHGTQDVINAKTLQAPNFVNTDTFLTILAPIESPKKDLSIGAKFVKNGSILTKLGACKVLALSTT